MKIVLLSLSMLLMATTTEQCGAPVTPGTGVCVAKAHKVHQSSGTPTHMTGKATVACGQEAADVFLQVKIEVKKSSGWQDSSSSMLDDDYVGYVAVGKQKNAAVKTAALTCTPGTFRTAAREG